MGIFSRMFGNEDNRTATKVVDANFITTLAMHVRGELEPALASYQAMTERDANDFLALFFTAAAREKSCSKESKVGPFNRLSEEHNKIVQAARKDVEKLKAQWATFNTTVTEHNKSCSSIIITAEDRDEVMKARSTVAGR
ncbi:MAG: hypothetical protein FPO08_04430 [Geobacter sp.]|nr:MAG: hypothetical protein FPO08_04430 [Geobacter sp.]